MDIYSNNNILNNEVKKPDHQTRKKDSDSMSTIPFRQKKYTIWKIGIPIICLILIASIGLYFECFNPSRLDKRINRIDEKINYSFSQEKREQLLEKEFKLMDRKDHIRSFFNKYYINQFEHAKILVENKHYERGIKILNHLSQNDLSFAQAYLGMLYYDGIGVEQDINMGLDLFKKSYNSDTIACKYLGDYYSTKSQNDKNVVDGYPYYKKYIELGGLERFTQFAVCSALKGDNKEDCIEYAKKGIQFNNKHAAIALGYVYSLVKEHELAIYYLQKQVNEGSGDALYFLGCEYYHHGKYEEEYNCIQDILTKYPNCSKIGLTYQLLGDMYENGYYVNRNLEKAIQFYDKAAEEGNEYSIKASARLSEILAVYKNSKEAREYGLTPLASFIYYKLSAYSMQGDITQFARKNKSFKGLMDIMWKCHAIGLSFNSIPDYVCQMGYSYDRHSISVEFARYIYDDMSIRYNIGTFNEYYSKVRVRERANTLFDKYYLEYKGHNVPFSFDQFYETITCDM